MRWYILAALVAAVVTFLLTWATIRISRRYRLYPAVRERDVHTRPTPRLGGVAMFLGVLASFAFASQLGYFSLVFAESQQVIALIAAAGLIVLVGVIDDLVDLDWMIKLAAQIGAGLILAWQGIQILSLPLGDRVIGSPLMGMLITVFAVVLTMNAVNFIDGLDGLVAGVALIANGVFFLYSYLLAVFTERDDVFSLASLISASIIGACLGFLPWNWRPAKIFMGDSGALLVGLLMATSALAVTGQVDAAAMGSSQLLPAFIPILLPFAILILPILDFCLAVFRRLRAGKSPFEADRKHLHHRLMDMGHGHLQSVFVFYAWTLTVSLGVLLVFLLKPYTWALLFLGVGLAGCTVFTFWPILHRRISRARSARRSTDLIESRP